MQRAEPDDKLWYASHHPDQLMTPRAGTRPAAQYSRNKAAETEIGDWKMPQFRAACSYAVSQGWLIVQDDTLTLTTAGLAAA
jgi:hypothetical protein